MNQAQGQIQTQLQRRADLIPNLVNTVKGVTKQEDTVFISIANARADSAVPSSQAMSARWRPPIRCSPRAGPPPRHRRELSAAAIQPELPRAQDQLEGTENRISVARQDYNTAVGEYNAYIRRFPNNLTAKVFGMGKPREYFEASQGAARRRR